MKIPTLIKVYITVIVACIGIYLFVNHDKSVDDIVSSSKSQNNETYSYTNPIHDDNSINSNLFGNIVSNSNVIVEPERNGEIMSASMTMIEKIFQNLTKEEYQTSEKCDEYIVMIENVALSHEYDVMKSKLIQKIEYFKEYLQSADTMYFDLYNSINTIECCKEAFDKAGVEYEPDPENENSIIYHYHRTSIA